MTSVVCGFNGFGQLNNICCLKSGIGNSDSTSVAWSEINKDIESLGFSWTGVIFKKDGNLKFHGLVKDLSGQSVDLTPPSSSPPLTATINDRFVLVVTSDGECWKFEPGIPRWTPVKLALESGKIVKAVVSDTISLFLTDTGKVFDLTTELEIPEKVTDIVCGLEHAVMLTESGCVYTIGSNSRGQLGVGDMEIHEGPMRLTILDGVATAVSIAAGGWHSCIVSSTGDLYTWGSNSAGQLSLPPTTIDRSRGVAVAAEPTLVDFLFPAPVKTAACGTAHTIVVLSDGSVWGCGRNHWLQLGVREAGGGEMSFIYKGPAGHHVTGILATQWNSLITLEPDGSS